MEERTLRYRRVVLKLSGEALSWKMGGSGIDTATLKATAEELRDCAIVCEPCLERMRRRLPELDARYHSGERPWMVWEHADDESKQDIAVGAR